ncbi:MAG: S8 family serine peptidase [Acidobacteriota bacterium]
MMRKWIVLLPALLLGMLIFAARPALRRDAAAGPPPQASAYAASLRPSPADLSSFRRDGNFILLRSGVFDPLTQKTPFQPSTAMQTATSNPYRLVQFTSDLDAADRAALKAAGVELISYIPSRAYIVRAAGARAVNALLSFHSYRWMGNYEAGYKIAPVLQSGAWTQGVYLDLRLFPHENPFKLLHKLQAMNRQIAYSMLTGTLKDGRTLRVYVPAGQLHPFVDEAASQPGVRSVNPWYLPHIMNDNSIWVIQSYDTTDKTKYNLSAPIWNHGITGTGQTPAVCDTGVDDDMCFFRYDSSSSSVTDAQYPSLPNPGTLDTSKKVLVYDVLPGATAYDGNTSCNGDPESEHGTHTTCTVAGDDYATLSTPASGGHTSGDGMAPNAKIIFQDAGSETSGCLDGLATDLSEIFQQAYNAGARIHSNSWGSDTAGVYTSDCLTVDRFVYRHPDMTFFFANGNAGPASQTVGSPAAAKNCVSVGATSNGSSGANTIASFSSRGPTADGRRKPDVCAPGVNINSASGDTNHTDGNCGTKQMSGTSMATPTTAGGATLLREYFSDGFWPTGQRNAPDAMDPSAALMKAALINGAVSIGDSYGSLNSTLYPNNSQGWGRILLDQVCYFPGNKRKTLLWDKPNEVGLKTGDVDTYHINVTSKNKAIKVTLVWTDPEADTSAATDLINNLDLEVTNTGNGRTFLGNVFSGGKSVTGGSADNVNNVEEVFRPSAGVATWTIKVKATNVPGTPDEPGSDRQGYALVVTFASCSSSLNTPGGLSATDNGTTGIDLSWNAVAGANAYDIYRADGDCTSAASDFHFIKRVTATGYTDTIVQGGYDYAYKVRAADNCTVGALSTCASAVYSGNCTLPPDFGGLVSAANNTATPACDVVLTWNAGTSNCPYGPSVTYDVYRGNSPYFTVDGAHLIAAGVSGTSYTDVNVLSGTTYYYVVRAEDGTSGNGGPANGGNTDSNDEWRSATPEGSSTSPGTWTDDGGDTTARLVLSPPWTITDQMNHTTGGSLCYHNAPDGGTYPANTCAAATTPPITLQSGSPQLSYWVNYNVEYQWDGVVVEISADGGSTWTPITPTGGYPSDFSQTGTPPINVCGFSSSQGAFNGPSGNGALTGWTQYTHDLSAYAGQTVEIRWEFSSDPGAEYEGFYLDDIQITNASVPGPCGPPGIPNGSASGTSPMQASKSAADGSSIDLSWDNTCSPPQVEIIYGMGSQLPSSYSGTYGVSGAVCGLSPSSPYTWTNTPSPSADASHFMWWIITGTDGAGTEGAWGKNSGGLERNGPGANGSSGQCGNTDKLPVDTCGQ